MLRLLSGTGCSLNFSTTIMIVEDLNCGDAALVACFIILSERPEYGQEVAQCNGLVPQDGTLRLHRLHRRGSLMPAFQDRSSEGEYVLAFLLDFALDHWIHRENVRHRRARRGEMRMQLLIRVCLPGGLVEATIEILRQEHIEPNQRFRDLDMTREPGFVMTWVIVPPLDFTPCRTLL